MVDAVKCKDLRIKIDGTIVGVVESAGIELGYEGGTEPTYDADSPSHAIGTKKASFSIRRWLGVDSDKDLLFDLFNQKLPFSMSSEVKNTNDTKLTLSNCKLYRWRYIMGSANDIVGEEASGEATDWSDLTNP